MRGRTERIAETKEKRARPETKKAIFGESQNTEKVLGVFNKGFYLRSKQRRNRREGKGQEEESASKAFGFLAFLSCCCCLLSFLRETIIPC